MKRLIVRVSFYCKMGTEDIKSNSEEKLVENHCKAEEVKEAQVFQKPKETWSQFFWRMFRHFKNWIAVIIPLVGVIIYVLSTLVDVILFNAIPTTLGEFRFRDISETSKNVEWKIFNRTEGEVWKKMIQSHPCDSVSLGDYEILTATVFVQSRGHSKRSVPLGPVDTRFVSFILIKENKSRVYFTIEKIPGAPEVVQKVLDDENFQRGGIYAQISHNRDASIQSMHQGGERKYVDVGTLRWSAKTGSVVTLKDFLNYYTQTSAHLGPGYNYYSRNGHHFVKGVVSLLRQLQDVDLGSAAIVAEESGTSGVGQTVVTKVLKVLGSEM